MRSDVAVVSKGPLYSSITRRMSELDQDTYVPEVDLSPVASLSDVGVSTYHGVLQSFFSGRKDTRSLDQPPVACGRSCSLP